MRRCQNLDLRRKRSRRSSLTMFLAVQVMTCGVREDGKHVKKHGDYADTVLISFWCLCIFSHKQGGYGFPPGGGGV
eukprot:1328246-Karenia_brevis.AAC.1